MATVDNRGTIRVMLERDGVYPGDPQAYSIWEYRHRITGRVLWAVYWTKEGGPTEPYVGECELLWTRFGGHVNPLGILADKQAETHES